MIFFQFGIAICFGFGFLVLELIFRPMFKRQQREFEEYRREEEAYRREMDE